MCVILFTGGGVSVPACSTGHMTRGSLSRRVSVRETPRTVTSGRYASYWNAFLFSCNFGKNLPKQLGFCPLLTPPPPSRLGNLGSTTGGQCVCPQNLCLHIWKLFCFCYKSKVINSFRLPKVAKDCLSCLILLPDSPDNIGRSLSQCCLEHFLLPIYRNDCVLILCLSLENGQ